MSRKGLVCSGLDQRLWARSVEVEGLEALRMKTMLLILGVWFHISHRSSHFAFFILILFHAELIELGRSSGFSPNIGLALALLFRAKNMIWQTGRRGSTEQRQLSLLETRSFYEFYEL